MSMMVQSGRFGAASSPPITATAYLYYRIVVTAVDGGSSVSGAEVEMLDSGSINFLRLGISAGAMTVSATGAGSAAQVGDVDESSGWQSTSTFPVWIKWTATGTEDFTGCILTAATGTLNRSPKNFTIEYSDDNSSWSVAATVINQTGWTASEKRRFTWTSVGTHKYWRVNVSAVDGGSTLAVNDASFFKASGAMTSATDRGALIRATTTFSTEIAPRLADGSTVTGWTSNANVPQTLTFALPVAKALATMKWTSRSGEANRSPKDFTIDGSNDGATWTNLKTVSGSTGWTAPETRIFTG